jgi:SAM-dependent methyltransferase
MLYEFAKRTLAGNALYEAVRSVHVRRRQARQAREREQREAWLATKPYQEQLAIRADDMMPVKGKRVLVVGANRGEDCRHFVEMGAAEVHGLDVIAEIGADFAHPKVHYHRVGIEANGLPNGHFDLVFSMATMEHVPDIEAGFAEMARLVARGGLVYSVAAPLWQSPYGHHMSCFEGHPWVHLVHDNAEALKAYAAAEGIAGERGHNLDGIAAYIFDPENFNRRPGREYDRACAGLVDIAVQRNELVLEAEVLLNHPLGQQALAKGYSRKDLLAVQHRLIATKP